MTMFSVPLLSVNESFRVSINGTDYTIATQWNNAIQIWVMSIVDFAYGIPMVPGADLLTGLEYLGIQAKFTVPDFEHTILYIEI